MTIEKAKAIAVMAISGMGTLKKSGLIELLETLLKEIVRLEDIINAKQEDKP